MAGRGPRPPLRAGAALAALALAAGCADDGRPPAKPPELVATAADAGGRPVALRVETRSGAILLPAADGGVEAVPLDSPRGRAALAGSEAALARLRARPPREAGPAPAPASPARDASSAPTRDAAPAAAPASPPGDATTPPASPAPAAPEPDGSPFVAPEDIAPGGTLPVLPDREGEGPVDASLFLGTSVRVLDAGPSPLVEVSAALKRGVDAELAFAYATCALAAWAERNGTPFARHVRTLQGDAEGRLGVASVFLVSRVEPVGLRVVEAGATLGECAARGIPAG